MTRTVSSCTCIWTLDYTMLNMQLQAIALQAGCLDTADLSECNEHVICHIKPWGWSRYQLVFGPYKQ